MTENQPAEIQFDPIQIEPAYRKVSNLIERKIISGEIEIGQPFPSEADLAAQFCVARSTVCEASNNSVLQLSHQPVAKLIHPAIGKFIHVSPLELGQRLLSAHEKIFEAILIHDRSQAEQWMKRHIIDFLRGYEMSGFDPKAPLELGMLR